MTVVKPALLYINIDWAREFRI